MATKKQLAIEGTQDDLIPAIEEAGEKVREITERRKALQKDEQEARSALIEAMREHKRDSYRYEDDDGRPIIVYLKHGEVKVSVRREKEHAPPGVESQAAE